MLKGLSGLAELPNLAKKAHEFQSELSKTVENLRNVQLEGESGAGLVKIKINAAGNFEKVEIDPSILNEDDKEVIEDLLLAAIKDAQQKAKKYERKEMEKVAVEAGIPEKFRAPF